MKRYEPKPPLGSEPTLNFLYSLRNRNRHGGSSDSSDLGRARDRLEAQTQRGNIFRMRVEYLILGTCILEKNRDRMYAYCKQNKIK
jgi:hypothetical protein